MGLVKKKNKLINLIIKYLEKKRFIYKITNVFLGKIIDYFTKNK